MWTKFEGSLPEHPLRFSTDESSTSSEGTPAPPGRKPPAAPRPGGAPAVTPAAGGNPFFSGNAPKKPAPAANAAPPVANPFLAGTDAPATSAADVLHSPNPTPQAAPTPAPPAVHQAPVQTAPAAQPAPRVIPPAAGAPLQAQPGVVAPVIKDAHAEFRRGSWQKPAALVALAAAGIGAFVFFMPEPEEKKVVDVADRDKAVIGGSVSPEVIAEEKKEITLKPAEEEAAAPAPEPAKKSASNSTTGSANFADAFQASSRN